MYKNQLQELAQRSCFNLPSYSCIREGPDHAPRFKATVNFNGETFESPTFCSTLRQAEHSAAEVALNMLATRGPSRALAAKVLDETGVYKNLLQETAHRAGLNLPVYSTVRSGPGHFPIFSCTVELAGKSFTGQPARTKKQAQKNAAMAAWSALRKLSQEYPSSSTSLPTRESGASEEQEQVIVARFLASSRPSESKSKELQKHRIRPVKRNVCSPQPRSLYPMQYSNWAYTSFPHEMVMYHIWEQEKLLQQQLHLLRLPISPSAIRPPHVFPVMQSMLSPESCHYFPVRQLCTSGLGPRIAIATSGPPFCSANRLIPDPGIRDPTTSRSRVTIQEIQEEKIEESSDVPLTGVSNSLALGDRGSDLRLSSRGHGNVEEDAQLQISHALDSYPSYTRPQCPPRASSFRRLTQPPSSFLDPATIRSPSSVPLVRSRTQNSALEMFAPPRMRTGVTSSSTRPRIELSNPNMEPLRPRLMAPPVRIRSVVPVCSAPSSGRSIIFQQNAGSNVTGNRSSEPEEALGSDLHELQL